MTTEQLPVRPAVATSTATEPPHVWYARTRSAVAASVREFVVERCGEHLAAPETAVLGRVIVEFAGGGKYLRSAFQLAGWLTVRPESPAAIRAAGSAELLHCFALLQDDVMDRSPLRRGLPAAHIAFADWHARQGLSGSSERFGEAAAILAADLCLVWAEQLLRESGVDRLALARGMRRYDVLRSELAVGQFRDLVNESRREPALSDVLAVARAKSGNYTVRRPLELGAELAGAGPDVLAALGRYGTAVGEAFQMRDDLLGVFGDPDATGKPVGDDIRARKATAVLVLAHQHADDPARRELRRLDARAELDAAQVARYVRIIEDTGTRPRVEQLIRQRVSAGIDALAGADLAPQAHAILVHLARSCADRVH
ncbi:polyprenyl synthetase family protein [Nocardia sp. CDC159]|uniref:Polyprenyl synthetase family protein n=1 Tax=Nocardia pulmonis TaxID=2951408 RepID=A0A9X2IY87_9NOCA|nr:MULTISPECIES: polyprenyl synthetase family protein [Nocardia]MCM6775389.1 polyprenyl synthetase family protein [Nocardia pulmonis]MCM6787877.1 polyprenyl synthetase family protein [Nocardia sp. CDC159]